MGFECLQHHRCFLLYVRLSQRTSLCLSEMDWTPEVHPVPPYRLHRLYEAIVLHLLNIDTLPSNILPL